MAGGGRLRAAGQTHPGRRRPKNEDDVLVRADLGLFAVADGVSRERAGAVASRLAVLSLSNFFEATAHGDWPAVYRARADLTLQPEAQRLCAAVRKANIDVHSASGGQSDARLSTTIVAAFCPRHGGIHIAHVGDSRCYRIRGERIDVLTRDHTLRNDAQDEFPDIDEARLAQIPKSVLSRALGRAEAVEIAARSLDPEPGDRFLLCSDGLTRMIEDDVILATIRAAASPEEATARLVDLANEAGGKDNITVVTIYF
jgi:PPM family protein phosphatase